MHTLLRASAFNTGIALVLLVGLVADVCGQSNKPAVPRDWFVGPWLVRYQANYVSADLTIKSDEGTKFTKYSLSFFGGTTYFVHGDRSGSRVRHDGTIENFNSKGGAVEFEDRQSEFFHRALWKAADGKPGDYVFQSVGMLKGNGQFNADDLTLNLEWTTGAGRGTADGKLIAEPVGMHTLKSQWTLKPQPPSPNLATDVAKPKLVLAATRTVKMPQQLAGCPPLDVVEQVVVRQADVADLAATVKKLERPDSGAGSYVLTVTVKNAGPDAARAPRLGVVLPTDAAPRSETGDGSTTINDSLVTVRLPELRADESREVAIPFALGVPPTGEEGEKDLVLIEVRDTTYDPKPGNNGGIERLLELLRKQ